MDTPAIRNNNPGNLKDPSTGQFRMFKTPQEGYAALLNDLQAKQTGTTTTGLGPSSTLVDFASRYAPANDKNNVGQYAANLANQLGVPPTAQLKDLDLARWAAAVAKNEDHKSIFGNQKIAQTPQERAAEPLPEQKRGFLEEAAGDISGAFNEAGEAVGRAASGQINPLSGVIQTGGALAGGINELTNTALQHIPVVGGVVKKAEELVGKGAEKVLGTELGQKGLMKAREFAEKHPELAKNIESGIDIATAVPVLKGLGVVKGAASGGIKRALVGSIDDVVEMVGPKLTAKELAESVAARGTTKKGILGKIDLAPDPKVQELAEIVAENVPKFNPAKGFTFNINKTKEAVNKMVAELKKDVIASGQDRIYSFKELGSKLKNLERPLMVSSDNVLNNAYDRVITKALEIARKRGGKISNLFDARKEFDAFIARQFPNLYSSEVLTPMRQAVKDIRNALTDFTADNLPDVVGLRDRLLTQHQLINAIENMAEKAVKEVGTTAIQRSPAVRGLINLGSRAVKGAAEGVGIGKVLDFTD